MKHILLIIYAFIFAITTSAQVSPLIPVEWGQHSPYNDKCPMIGADHALAGCVAVTMSQMMSSFRYPSSLSWNGIISGDSVECVSDLIYSAGLAAKTNYSKTTSIAQPTNQLKALVDSFGYDKDIIILSRKCVKDDVWEQKIKSELDNGRPVMVSARDAKYGGHSFIIDGYNDEGYHVNWGWAGEHNGYYPLNALKPSTYDFSYDQRLFLGCKPDDGKQTVSNYLEAVCQLSDTLLFDSEVKNGKQITLNITISNCTYRPYQGFYYIYYVGDDGSLTRTSKRKNYVLSWLQTDYSKEDDITLDPPTVPGHYTLYMQSSQLLDYEFNDMGLSGTTSFTILPSTDGIEKPVIDVEDINNGLYYNAAGQRVAKPSCKHLIKRTRQGSQLVI